MSSLVSSESRPIKDENVLAAYSVIEAEDERKYHAYLVL